jgi:anaerobic selenocysteine-containing dehydrogenase
VPWDTLEDFYDYRVARTGMSFADLVATTEVHFAKPEFRKYEKTGFATPSGKVELKSSVLEGLGFDPLPYFREDPPRDDAYPLMMFTGVREDGFFQTGHRHIPEMRARHPEPEIYLNEKTARTAGVRDGEWVAVENQLGRIKAKLAIRDAMPDDLVRVPEMPQGHGQLSGAHDYADSQLCRDDDDFLDREQGIPHIKGIPCRVVSLMSPSGDAEIVDASLLEPVE